MDERPRDQPPIKREQRRGSRFPVAIPVEVKWQEPSGKIFREAAQAREVNAHGGLLDMKIYPWVGGDLELTNLVSGQCTQARALGTRRSKDARFLGVAERSSSKGIVGSACVVPRFSFTESRMIRKRVIPPGLSSLTARSAKRPRQGSGRETPLTGSFSAWRPRTISSTATIPALPRNRSAVAWNLVWRAAVFLRLQPVSETHP